MSAKEVQSDIKGELLRRKSTKSSKGNQYTLQQSSQVKSSKIIRLSNVDMTKIPKALDSKALLDIIMSKEDVNWISRRLFLSLNDRFAINTDLAKIDVNLKSKSCLKIVLI